MNAKDKDGLTALERAGLFGPRIEVAELLVSAGANVNMLVSPDKTLIDWLSSLGRDNFHKQRNALVEFLRSKGAKSAKELIGQGQKLESRADAMQTKRPTQETTDREDGQFAELWRAGTDGANYELGTEDIVKRLKAWRRLCSFRIVDAKHDLVILEFETLPKDLDAFASDIYDFCPDVVDQGTVLAADVLETDLDGLEFLKRQLQEKRRLTLWWD